MNFKCSHCQKEVTDSGFMGTANRNHCLFCLWSKHVDLKISGDRKSKCQALMKPIGLTFKQEGIDKYGQPKQGELMLVHQCLGCKKISINRIAGDDKPESIIALFKQPPKIKLENIKFLTPEDEKQLLTQLYGRIN
jgi:hypothetical protein